MKFSAWQQSYINRRSNSFRAPLPLESSGESSSKSPVTTFSFLLHAACCLISVVLGFRFSRLVYLFFFSVTSTNLSAFRGGEIPTPLVVHSSLTTKPMENPANQTAGSRVLVGRHGIQVRPWPHPNPEETMKAYRIIERVQREQRALFGVKKAKTVIAVTPTHVRTFQKLHLSCVMHSLMLVPYDVVWIVVEAGRVSNETASIIAKSGLRTIHVGFNHGMPISWDERHKLEARMRLHALRWKIDPPLDITVPSKRTPWPDAPRQFPINEKELIGTQEHTSKHSTKTRTSRSRRSRNKRRHGAKVIGVKVSKHSDKN